MDQETLRCIRQPALTAKLFLLRSRLCRAGHAGAVSRSPDRVAFAVRPEHVRPALHLPQSLLSRPDFHTGPTENHRAGVAPVDRAECGPTLMMAENKPRSSVRLRELLPPPLPPPVQKFPDAAH